MKTKIIITALLAAITFGNVQGQRRTPKKATKVVMEVDKKTNKVKSLQRYDEIEETYREKIDFKKNYANSKFYSGLLRGKYKVGKNGIEPILNSTISVNISKQFFPGDQFIPGDQFLPGNQFLPGDQFILGRTKTKIVSNKRGRLVLRAQ